MKGEKVIFKLDTLLMLQGSCYPSASAAAADLRDATECILSIPATQTIKQRHLPKLT